MVYIIVISTFVLGWLYLKSTSLHIDFRSFFYKGFKKIDNEFRALLLLRKTRKRKNLLRR